MVTFSSTAGLAGGEFLSAYAASKFALEGWMESLSPEVAPFGIRTMLVEPGFFRTELLATESTNYAESSIGDYAERNQQIVSAWKGMSGLQGGDPAKLANALVHLAGHAEPPVRWAAGAEAVGLLEQKAQTLVDQVNAHRDLSSSLAFDDAAVRSRSKLSFLNIPNGQSQTVDPQPVETSTEQAPARPSTVQVEAAKLRLVTDHRLGKESPEWLKRVAMGLPARSAKAAG